MESAQEKTMSRIEANPQVQQELQSRGVTDSVGVFGNHQVRIGQQSPVRLDRIRSAPIPFAGFSRATKIERGTAGVNAAGSDALRQLTRPGGRLDAGKLLGDFKAMRAQLNRLNQLGQIAPPPESAILRAYAPLIQNLSNEELAAVFQSFTSAEMDLLQTGLRHEGANGSADARKMASDLFDLQALVTKEISDRVARDIAPAEAASLRPLSESFGPLCRGAAPAPAPVPAPGPHIASANLFTLAERSAQGATARERMDFDHEVAAHSIRPEPGQPSLSARAMGDILRAAPLTMNINTDFLFGASSILTQPGSQVQNYYHLAREVQDGTRTAESLPGGMGYTAPRDAAESLLFPELGEHGVENPNARPTYAALNVNRNEFGAAPNSIYGGAHIVFRPEVAQRATYTADDTFYAIPASFTPERRENFYNRLSADLGQNSAFLDFVREARDPNSELHRDFEAYFDGIAANPHASIASLDSLPPGIGSRLHAACDTVGMNHRDGENFMRGHLIASFGDGAQARARTATYDSLETLLPGMATPAFNSLARAAIERNPVVGLAGTNYIEAQIQGGIVPERDIAEIRVNQGEILPGDLSAAMERAEAFTRATGIPVTFFDPDDQVRQGSLDATAAAVTASQNFNAGHWNQDRLSEEVGAIRANPQGAIDRLLAEPSAGLGNLPADVRNLQGAALARAMNKLESRVNELARDPSTNLQSENALVRQAFSDVFTPLLRQKAELLGELDTLHFDNPAQKKAFANWVMSAMAITSPEELRLVHANATRHAEALRTIADANPPLSPEAAMQKFIETMKAGASELGDFFRRHPEFDADHTRKEIDRIAFMGVALLRNSEGGEEALGRLTDRMTSPGQLALAGQMSRVATAATAESRSESAVAAESFFFNLTTILVDTTRYSLCRETGREFPEFTPFAGELSLLPEGTRAVLREVAPATAAELERTHPAYPTFPAPANPGALPQNEADRRQFLVDLLHPGGTYVAHEMSFERGTSVHGRGHIARAWIFAETMCNILGEMGVTVDRNAVLCGIAGHDMGRQGGGQDRWEGRSAAFTTSAMRTAFGAENLGEAYQAQVGLSIDAHGSRTLEGLLLNAADSLDIGRTATFDPRYFSFLRGADQGAPLTPEATRMREQLAREADLLQRITDPLCQARPALNHLVNEAMDSPHPHLADTLMAQQAEIRGGVADAYARRWSESGEDYLRSVEDAIRLNPDMFPLLNRYYTQPMAQAGEPTLPANAERINTVLAQTAWPTTIERVDVREAARAFQGTEDLGRG
jgi:hypothetical protein